MFDSMSFRAAFSSVINSDFVYFDNAATAQKPDFMVKALSDYYSSALGSAGRGQNPLSEKASAAYAAARRSVMRFIGAAKPTEIIFTTGATDSLNMLAASYRRRLTKKSNIVISALEHNANYLPWKNACEEAGAELRIIELLADGSLDMDAARRLIDENTLLLSVTAASNLTGRLTDVRALCDMAHEAGAAAAVDASQYVPHIAPDVNVFDCDYLVFSAHKVYGSEGLGVLYCRESLLDTLAPFRYGGGMAEEHGGNITPLPSPERFEAGTHHVAGAVAFAATLDFLSGFDAGEKLAYTRSFSDYVYSSLSAGRGINFIGHSRENLPVLSLTFEGVSPSDIDLMLSMRGFCLRSGKHCAFLPVSRLAAGEKLFAYPFSGYWKDVGTISSLWEANMDLLGDKPELDLSDESWRIFARHSASAPQFVGARAQVENSYITEGCEIYGTVKNSVVGPGVRVMHGAVVEDSVLMGDATVQPGAVIRYTILDTGVTVGAGATVGADRASGAAITVVGEDVTIDSGATVQPGAMLSE